MFDSLLPEFRVVRSLGGQNSLAIRGIVRSRFGILLLASASTPMFFWVPPISSPAISAMALRAVATALVVDAKIVAGKRVSTLAFRLSGVLGRGAIPSHGIVYGGPGRDVLRVAAISHSTLMVERESRRNFADQQSIGPSMRHPLSAPARLSGGYVDGSVPISAEPIPLPAAIWVADELARQPLGESSVFGHPSQYSAPTHRSEDS